jgi:hypothetical protein
MTTFNALVLGFCVGGALNTTTMLHLICYSLGIAIVLLGEFARYWNRQRFYDEYQSRKGSNPSSKS